MKTFILALVCLVCFGTLASADNGRRQQIRVQPVIQVQRFNSGYHRQDFRFQRIYVGGYSQYSQQLNYSQQYLAPTETEVVEEVQTQPVIQRVVRRVVVEPVYTQPVIQVQRVVRPVYNHGGYQQLRIRGY